MRIPLPERIPVGKAVICSGLLVIVELIEGTDSLYSALVFTFLMLSVFAFNMARGLTRPSGAYIFFFSVLVVDVGTVYKALLGEAAQTHLESPLLLMSVYVVTMAGMLVAAFLSRKVATSTNGITELLNLRNVDFGNAAIGSFVLFFALYIASSTLTDVAGGLLRALAQINQFLPLSIMLGTIAAVQNSGGRRSTSALTWAAMIYMFYEFGLLAFSKQGMFTPVTCWLIGVGWTRFRLRPLHLILVVGFSIFAQTVLVPLAASGRDEVIVGSVTEREAIVEHDLTHIQELRKKTHEHSVEQGGTYYNTAQGIFDRLTMIPPDGQLVNFTAQGHYFGYLPLRYYFENWVPHIIDPHKLEGIRVGGNTYAHEMGGLNDQDFSTGISFSPAAEAFHMDGWRGILLLITPIMILLFVTTDYICGDLRANPWGMLPMLVFAHTAPEGLLGNAIWWSLFGNIGVLFAIFFCGYVAPLLGLLLRGDPRMKGSQPITSSRLHETAAISADPA